MLSAWYFGIPAVTRWTGTLFVLLYLVTLIDSEPYSWCLSPKLLFPSINSTLHYEKLHTLFLSSLVHLSCFHLFFNLSTFMAYGPSLETRFGSLKFFTTTLILTLLSNIFHLITAGLLRLLPLPHFLEQMLINTCSLGFSGVLFAYLAMDCFQPEHQNEAISVWGLFPVAKRYYPWVLLVLLQFLFANVSFLGHLSGLFVGWIYSKYPLDLPSSWLAFAESSLIYSYLAARTGWIPSANLRLPGSENHQQQISFVAAFQQQMQQFWASRSPNAQDPQQQQQLQQHASNSNRSAQSSNIASMKDLQQTRSNQTSVPTSSTSSTTSPSSSSSSSTTSSHVPFSGSGYKLGNGN